MSPQRVRWSRCKDEYPATRHETEVDRNPTSRLLILRYWAAERANKTLRATWLGRILFETNSELNSCPTESNKEVGIDSIAEAIGRLELKDMTDGQCKEWIVVVARRDTGYIYDLGTTSRGISDKPIRVWSRAVHCFCKWDHLVMVETCCQFGHGYYN